MKNHAPKVSNPIGQRLKLEMKKRGISSTELAKRADVKTSFIYDVISGKSANPSTVKLARVVESLGITLSHLVDNGDGIAAARSSQGDYVTIPRVNVEASQNGSATLALVQNGEHYLFRKSWIAERIGVDPAHLYLLSVRGDSMEPTLQHNDLVLVDTTKKSPSPPGIFVLFDGFGLATKRLEYIAHQRPTRIKIISDNPQYSAYERSATDTSIIGRVVWFAREI